MFKKLWERYVVWRYVEVGLSHGDYLSYSYMFNQENEGLERRYNKWKKRYYELGYQPLLIQDWIYAGGYGVPYKHLLRQPIRGKA